MQDAQFSSTTVSTASCTAAAITSSTVVAATAVAPHFPVIVASAAAVVLSVWLFPVIPALLLVVLRAFVAVVTVLSEALDPTGITLCVHGNPTAHH